MTRRILRLAATVVALLIFPAALEAAAEGEGQRIATAGNGKGAAPCDTCHGATGMGDADLVTPRLAGMSASYLEQQLIDFQKGTRTNPVMAVMAKGLTPEECSLVARYYAALPVVARPVQDKPDPVLLERGQRIAEDGLWSKGVPACYRCHGPDGAGVPPNFPAIVDQPRTYVVAQLQAWQQGARSTDPLGLMKAVASRLTPAEIDAVATWLSSSSAAPAKQ
jgi:cytochrome c553